MNVPLTFLQDVAGYAQAQKGTAGADAGRVKLATVDPDYDQDTFPTGTLPRVTFDGELVLSVKRYPVMYPYWPHPSDRVVMIPSGHTYVIIGTLTDTAHLIYGTSQYARDGAEYDNFSSASFTPTSGAPEFTFVTNGKGNLRLFVRADADADGEQFQADARVLAGGPSGSVSHSPETKTGGIAWRFQPAKTFAENFYGDRPLGETTPLPAGVYWARLEIFTEGGNIDILDQWMRYEPSL